MTASGKPAVTVVYRGERTTTRDLARRFGVAVDRINQRLRAGWTVEDAVETNPVAGAQRNELSAGRRLLDGDGRGLRLCDSEGSENADDPGDDGLAAAIEHRGWTEAGESYWAEVLASTTPPSALTLASSSAMRARKAFSRSQRAVMSLMVAAAPIT